MQAPDAKQHQAAVTGLQTDAHNKRVPGQTRKRMKKWYKQKKQ
jgi:hypothetical protein